MAHMLASIKNIVEEIGEPHRMALLLEARRRGVMYKLKCINPKGTRTRCNRVDRNFKPGEEKLVPADVAAFLWQKYNLTLVAGTRDHLPDVAIDNPKEAAKAPYSSPNFEEIVDETRQDLGPNLQLRRQGVTLANALIEEVQTTRAGRSGVISDTPSSAEIAEVARSAPPRPAGTGV